MKKPSQSFASFAVACLSAVLLWITASSRASAYIDPGTGSYFLQLLAAGLLAAIFTIKTFWRTIKDGCARLFSKLREP